MTPTPIMWIASATIAVAWLPIVFFYANDWRERRTSASLAAAVMASLVVYVAAVAPLLDGTRSARSLARLAACLVAAFVCYVILARSSRGGGA